MTGPNKQHNKSEGGKKTSIKKTSAARFTRADSEYAWSWVKNIFIITLFAILIYILVRVATVFLPLS
jgi:uncharacterized membrane-anchored protein